MLSTRVLTIVALAVLGPSGCEAASSAGARAPEARLQHWTDPRRQQPMAADTTVATPHQRPTKGHAGAIPEKAPAPVDAALTQALVAYEGTRARLSLDDLAGAKAEARKLTAANQPLVKLVAAARTFDAAPELTSARNAFGVISQQVIRLLIERPALRGGRTLYFCPIVQTYNKWVQSSGPIDNPYIGKQMTHCGVELAAWDAAS